MEEASPSSETPSPVAGVQKHRRHEVYILRDYKEYIGESLLIIFSVLLALVLTEVINNAHERSNTAELLKNIREELTRNKERAKQQYDYQTQVLKNIDSALKNEAFRQKIFADNEFYLTKYIAPQGVSYRDLNDVAWQIAKSNNITSKVDIKTVTMLTDIYDNQAKSMKLEDEVGNVLLSRDARDPQKAMVTLVMVRDTYHGWAYDRTPALLNSYDQAIKLLSDKE